MTNRLAYTHDEFFRDTFANRETALDFLQNYLPPQIKALVDFSTLHIKKDSFINPDLQPSYADLLYHLQWVEGVKGEVGLYLYLLFEHKAYPDPWTGLQLLEYQHRIWDLWRNQQQAVKKEEETKKRQRAKLPPDSALCVLSRQDRMAGGLEFLRFDRRTRSIRRESATILVSFV